MAGSMTSFTSVLGRALDVSGISLDADTVSSLGSVAAELEKWNKKINLTALRDYEDIAAKHFVDSLVLAFRLPERCCLLDVGSGAGFPAIPISLVRPDVVVTSIDAVAKKIACQRHIVRLLGLANFTAKHIRVESLMRSARFDVIVSRAFSDLGLFVKLSVSLLADHGHLIAMKGPAVDEELEGARSVLAEHGMIVGERHRYELPFGRGVRHLVCLHKSTN